MISRKPPTSFLLRLSAIAAAAAFPLLVFATPSSWTVRPGRAAGHQASAASHPSDLSQTVSHTWPTGAPAPATVGVSGSEGEGMVNVGPGPDQGAVVNLPPTVDAGPNRTVSLPSLAFLVGSATDDHQPAGSALRLTWTLVSGKARVLFINPHAARTPVLFSSAGVYVLRLTADDGVLNRSDTVVVTVSDPFGVGSTPQGPYGTGEPPE